MTGTANKQPNWSSSVAKRNGEVLFKGRSWEWGKGVGSTGENHPFRRKSQRMIERFEKGQLEKVELTVQALELMGVPVGAPDANEVPLDPIDHFVEFYGLGNRGVDVVLSRFEGARHDHDEDLEEERDGGDSD